MSQRPLRWLRGSLRHKLTVAAVTVQIVMLALLLGNTVRLFNVTIEEQTRLRINELTPVLNVALAPGVFRRDYVGTQEVLNELLGNARGSIEYLVVRDERGRVFAVAGPVDPDALPPAGSAAALSGPRLDALLPLRVGAEPVGELRYGLSLASLFDARREVLRQGVIIAALEVLLAVAALTLVAALLTRDLKKLVATTRAVTEGDYDVQAVVHSTDEIGRLARDFNAMSAAVRARSAELRKRDQEISAMNAELERRVKQRTAELEAANRELEAFSYSVSHDLRAPLRAIDGFSRIVVEDHGARLDAEARGYLERVRGAAQRMGALIDDLLELSRVGRSEMQLTEVDLSRLATEVVEQLRAGNPGRAVQVTIAPGLRGRGDERLLRLVLANLLGNAWKYTARAADARIELAAARDHAATIYCVRDNGAGFDMAYADKLFRPFQRLHRADEFEGTGVGLAIVARIVARHGGRVSAQGAPGQGARFCFTLD